MSLFGPQWKWNLLKFRIDSVDGMFNQSLRRRSSVLIFNRHEHGSATISFLRGILGEGGGGPLDVTEDRDCLGSRVAGEDFPLILCDRFRYSTRAYRHHRRSHCL